MILLTAATDAKRFAYPQTTIAWYEVPILLVAIILMSLLGTFLLIVLIKRIKQGVYIPSTLRGRKVSLPLLIGSSSFILFIGFVQYGWSTSDEVNNLFVDSVKKNYNAEVVSSTYIERQSDISFREVRLRLKGNLYECTVANNLSDKTYSIDCVDGIVTPLEQLGN